MLHTGDGPDAIQVDGADGGTGAGENIYLNYVGYGSAFETTYYLDKKLKEAGLRDSVTISSSGKLFTPAHAALAFAIGADVIDTARGAMLALGCIQSLKCHTNECPTGITTNSKWRMHGINIPEKSTRIHNYLSGFHHDMLELTEVMGHCDPRDINREDIRIISYKNVFVRFFDEDPFGVYMPMTRDIDEAADDRLYTGMKD
jgi:glutamate synthase domain-containing protein 2